MSDFNQFMEDFFDVIDSEIEIGMETKLDTIEEWDSLSIIKFVVLSKTKYGIELSRSDINSAITVGELFHSVTNSK